MKSECVTCKDKIDQYVPSNPEVTGTTNGRVMIKLIMWKLVARLVMHF